MKVLYGTANPGKLQHMREMLRGLDIYIIGLDEVPNFDGKVEECGNSPLENARIKALAYYRAYRMPVFSCDSGLYIEGLDEEEQPGVEVRRVRGRSLGDEEMIEYYSSIALRLGGKAKARYRNAICMILDESSIVEYDGEDICSTGFFITSSPHDKRINGFPIDSLSVDIASGRYYYDMEPEEYQVSDAALSEGFRSFFLKSIPGLKIKPGWV